MDLSMLAPWNDSSVLAPPIQTCPCDNNIDVQSLSHVCKNILKILSKQSPLHTEIALISRLVYKFDKKFRNDIGYRNFKKVKTALKKYLWLNLHKIIDRFHSILPSDDDDLYLPTRPMLQYVLIRIITFSKIMLRIYVCSKQAAIFYLHRIKRGEGYWMSLIPYSVLCRVSSMSLVLLQHSCRWYSQLYPFLMKLQLKGINFLSEDFLLPTDLEKWLDIKNKDNFGRFEWSSKEIVEIDPNFIEDTDDNNGNIILNFINQFEEESNVSSTCSKAEPLKINELNPITIKNVDKGEVISRDKFKTMFPASQQTKAQDKQRDSTHTILSVTNIKSLKMFIETEEQFRNDGSEQALTSHLSFMQWQALKQSLLNLDNHLSSDRKIEKKFYKIWKDKCMDYIL